VRWRGALLAAALALAAPALAHEAVATSQHRITVAGKPLAYTAEAARIPIRDAETGEPRGFMFYTAYRVPSKTPRPLTFVWNGGPGAASTLLHFEVAGPKRLEAGRLVDNADTWLTHTDLVFVDPIGTGFSRPAKAEYAEAFYGTLGDVASVTEFVRAWRRLRRAEDAPTFLAGESWGAGRAANVGYALLKRGLLVDGLFLISCGAGLKDDWTDAGDVAALRIAHLAATAAHHGRIAGADPEAARAAAEAWVRQTYIPALRRLGSLTESERDAIVNGLSRHTGLPPAAIDRRTLAVTPRQFRTNLVSGRTLDTFDMRLPGGQAGDGGPRGRVLLRYFADDLGYRTELAYVGLERLEDGYLPSGKPPQPVGARWNYATAPVTPEQYKAAYEEAVRTGAGPPQLGPPLPGTAEAVALNPKLKVLVASGLYDSLANCAGAAETERNLPPPLKAAMTFRCYVGGHMMYRDAPSRAALSRDVRALVWGQ
jgi:carboxypeptidase C (cathepsin A)